MDALAFTAGLALAGVAFVAATGLTRSIGTTGVAGRVLAKALVAGAGVSALATALDEALAALRQSGELLKIFQSHGLTLAAP